MSGDRNRRQCQRVIHNGIDHDEAFDAAIQKQLRIVFEEFGVVAVSYCKKKVTSLSKIVFNATDNWGAIKVTYLLSDHADHISTFCSQIASMKAGAVIEFTGG